MYKPFKEEKQLNIKLPWDTNTARSFALAVALTLLLLIFASQFKVQKPVIVQYSESNAIPLDLINFGLGDGTGMSKGNLSQEGASHKGNKPGSDIEDAAIAAKTKIAKSSEVDDPTSARELLAANELSSSEKHNDGKGSSAKNVGSFTGFEDGRGLGDTGPGPGSGYGLGPIEWGGGGNRIVLQKRLPKYPAGLNTNAQIRIKFVVSSDGFVTTMFPLQKGDPTLEKAAMDALRYWKFNPLKDNKEMYGIITFTFKLS